MSNLKDLGVEQKYEVFKLEDIEKLSKEDRKAIYDIFLKLHCNRVAGDKKPVNEYLVVNVDEPYAYKVAALIKGQEITRPIKVKCTSVMFGYGDLMTKGKEYEVSELEDGEYWIEDDQGQYNPFPQKCFEVISI